MKSPSVYRITNRLPQFFGERDLFVVGGEQEAAFFLAENGTIRKIAEIEIRRMRYGDRAGFFMQRGTQRSHGAAIRSGAAVDHAQKEKIALEFRRQFRARAAAIARSGAIDHVYVFAPAYRMTIAKALLPKPLRDRILFSAVGNFCGRHPFRLLEKVAGVVERRKAASTPAPKREAEKILSKTPYAVR